MQRIPILSRNFHDPVTLCVEASLDVIWKQDLDTLEGEHYDYIRDVIAVAVTQETVAIETCRTIEDPTRMRLELPRRAVANLYTS